MNLAGFDSSLMKAVESILDVKLLDSGGKGIDGIGFGDSKCLETPQTETCGSLGDQHRRIGFTVTRANLAVFNL